MKVLFWGLGCLLGAWPLARARAQTSANPVPVAQTAAGTELYVRDLPENLRPDRPLPTGFDNRVLLLQTGSGNLADIVQAGDANQAQIAVLGNANATTLTQQGTRNTADLRLTGDNNAVSATQRGTANRYELDLAGSNLPVSVVQEGNGNRVQSNLSGPGGDRRYGVQQVGNNNELTQRESATSVLPQGYSVEMRGTGIRMTIEQGRAVP
jgi:minor curlin subunit